VKIAYDPTKNAKNIDGRGLSFERAADFDFSSARFWLDERRPYPEARYAAIGYLDDRLRVLCFAEAVDGIRVISLRRANRREGVKHGFPLTRN
jgi:uncharacterized protein